jgi:hypothetical protein
MKHVVIQQSCGMIDVTGPFKAWDEADEYRNTMVKKLRAEEEHGICPPTRGVVGFYVTTLLPPLVTKASVPTKTCGCCEHGK